MKKLLKILSILLMVALLVTINLDVYAKSRSGGFKSSGSHSSSSSSSSKSSSSSSSGGFKSSNSYTKPSTATTDKTSTSTDKSTSTNSNSANQTPIVGSNNYSNNNHRSFIPMMFFGNSFGSSIFRYAGLIIILLIMFYAYRFIKRNRK
ncbi:hypothetical protein [Clostridium estertheticum]|uniref:hypothetical protein n=1 Tax=Clostridium estertheticum TaxID=238834 RepID=UPI001CF45AD4|nr:hypothetical protein [Clostridium estertheticum]MCB2355833.1 hypothetical protein [Clostridium estertheticum]WAG39419.1 hypothetical protein LL065_14020 [Clostridium estertheticum]